jgi:hypothetical protein
MTDAWMKRGGERQRFLEGLERTIMDELDETHSYTAAQCLFAAALLELISDQSLKGQPSELRFEMALGRKDNRFRIFVREKILPAVQEFARTTEEAHALTASLFRWSSESVVKAASAPLQTQETFEPDKVFGESA